MCALSLGLPFESIYRQCIETVNGQRMVVQKNRPSTLPTKIVGCPETSWDVKNEKALENQGLE
jgi:hypothetical protein